MQTLGLSQSTPASESRMKSLFWPSVTCAEDVDYLGTQGYWVCTLVAVLSFGVGASTKMPVFAFLTFCFFFIGGVGVRERSLYAAIMVFSLYSLDVLTGSVGVVKIIFIALLLSNVRATWKATNWAENPEQSAMPQRLGDTWTDKLSDRFPAWLWPKLRYPYYVFSFIFLGLAVAGLLLRLFISPEELE
jgi:hypothetical protein